MRPNFEEIVEAGYDQIAEQYQAWIGQVEDDPRLQFLNEVLRHLPDRPVALDLGCGAGVPCTALLAEHGDATGVDAIDDFMGTPMVNSSYDPETNRRLVREAGLTILTDQVLTWFDGHVTYQWVIAGRPSR